MGGDWLAVVTIKCDGIHSCDRAYITGFIT